LIEFSRELVLKSYAELDAPKDGFMSAKTIPKVVYDKRSDSLYIVLSEGFEEEFIELAPNVNLE
jgi:hypothetical protein